MKRYLIIVMVLTACSTTIAQTANNKQGYKSLKEMNYDTLQYIKTSFIARKSFYEHKELNVLLNDLEIPITYFLMGDAPMNRFISPDISIQFLARNKIELKRQRKIDPVIMTIEWETPLPKDSVIVFVRKSRVWTDEQKKYFAKQKVKEIDMVRYNFQ